jgi:hypothetical protein
VTYDDESAAAAQAEAAAQARQQEAWPTYWTNAPAAYDGFGTATIETTELVYEGRAGPYDHCFRRVRCDPAHLRWQCDRYASGLYVALTTDAWAEWLLTPGRLALRDNGRR